MKRSESRSRFKIAIVGSGPAGLMASTRLALSNQANQLDIHLFEKRPGLGRKLLIAGSSGLNISHEHSLQDFSNHYEGWDNDFWKNLLNEFGPKDWINFIEKKLGMETFLGTSQRYFVREMKASNLLKQWHFEGYNVCCKTIVHPASLQFQRERFLVQLLANGRDCLYTADF